MYWTFKPTPKHYLHQWSSSPWCHTAIMQRTALRYLGVTSNLLPLRKSIYLAPFIWTLMSYQTTNPIQSNSSYKCSTIIHISPDTVPTTHWDTVLPIFCSAHMHPFWTTQPSHNYTTTLPICITTVSSPRHQFLRSSHQPIYFGLYFNVLFLLYPFYRSPSYLITVLPLSLWYKFCCTHQVSHFLCSSGRRVYVLLILCAWIVPQ